MKIKLIDFGYKQAPYRAHENDAGADIYSPIQKLVKPNTTEAIPLGFGLELPDGFMGCIYPRSGLATKGIVCELPPIDSGYRGEIHAIVSNISTTPFVIDIGDRVGQLVITPVILADFVTEDIRQRGAGAFASTGR